MLLGFVNYIKSALLLTFSGSEERQERVWGLKNAEDIQNFWEQRAHWGLYIIIDQVNALETSKANQDENSNSVKEKVRTFLNTLSFHHHVIRSASPSYVTFQHMQRKQIHDIKITAQGGLSVGLFALPCSFRSPFVDSTCSLYGRPVRAAIQLLLVN